MALSDADIAGYAYNAGFRGGDLAIAVAIALAESGGDPTAVSPENSNGTRDYGLWQINSSHTDSGLFTPTSGNTPFEKGLLGGSGTIVLGNSQGWSDPALNAAYAFKLYQGRGGFGDWSTYNDKSFTKFLTRAAAAANAPNTSVTGGATSSDSPLSGLSGISDAVTSIAGAVFKMGAWASKPENWGRVAFVVVGGSMVLGALLVAVKPYVTGTAAKVANVATKVTPAGAAAGAIQKAAAKGK